MTAFSLSSLVTACQKRPDGGYGGVIGRTAAIPLGHAMIVQAGSLDLTNLIPLNLTVAPITETKLQGSWEGKELG